MTLKIVHEQSDDIDQSVTVEFTADGELECTFCHTVGQAKRFGIHPVCLDCLSNADDMISTLLHEADKRDERIGKLTKNRDGLLLSLLNETDKRDKLIESITGQKEDLYRRVIELESRNRNLTIGMYAAHDTLQKAMRDAGLEVA